MIGEKWPVAERDRFCTELWAGGKNEEGALVCYVYKRFAKTCGAREFRLFTQWLDRYVENWGHTDGLSLWLLGASIANVPASDRQAGRLDASRRIDGSAARQRFRWFRRRGAGCILGRFSESRSR